MMPELDWKLGILVDTSLRQVSRTDRWRGGEQIFSLEQDTCWADAVRKLTPEEDAARSNRDKRKEGRRIAHCAAANSYCTDRQIIDHRKKERSLHYTTGLLSRSEHCCCGTIILVALLNLLLAATIPAANVFVSCGLWLSVVAPLCCNYLDRERDSCQPTDNTIHCCHPTGKRLLQVMCWLLVSLVVLVPVTIDNSWESGPNATEFVTELAILTATANGDFFFTLGTPLQPTNLSLLCTAHDPCIISGQLLTVGKGVEVTMAHVTIKDHGSFWPDWRTATASQGIPGLMLVKGSVVGTALTFLRGKSSWMMDSGGGAVYVAGIGAGYSSGIGPPRFSDSRGDFACTDCVFNDNHNPQDGGAIMNVFGSLRLVNPSFADNDAKGNGTECYCDSPKLCTGCSCHVQAAASECEYAENLGGEMKDHYYESECRGRRSFSYCPAPGRQDYERFQLGRAVPCSAGPAQFHRDHCRCQRIDNRVHVPPTTSSSSSRPARAR